MTQTRKQKLEAISWAGFDVEDIETAERQVGDLIRALHGRDFRAAQATANAIKARMESVAIRCERHAKREGVKRFNAECDALAADARRRIAQ